MNTLLSFWLAGQEGTSAMDAPPAGWRTPYTTPAVSAARLCQCWARFNSLFFPLPVITSRTRQETVSCLRSFVLRFPHSQGSCERTVTGKGGKWV